VVSKAGKEEREKKTERGFCLCEYEYEYEIERGLRGGGGERPSPGWSVMQT
jgi:hypothetical protein